MASRWWRAVDAAGVRVAAARTGSRTDGALRLVARTSDGAGLWLATAAALAAAGGTRGRRAAARGPHAGAGGPAGPGGGRPARKRRRLPTPVAQYSVSVPHENLVSAVP
jgi:hypothetical protein